MIQEFILSLASILGLTGITADWLSTPLNMGLIQISPLALLEIFLVVDYILLYVRLAYLYKRMFALRPVKRYD